MTPTRGHIIASIRRFGARVGWLPTGLVVLGLVLVGTSSWTHLDAGRYQKAQSKKLDDAVRAAEKGAFEAAPSTIRLEGPPPWLPADDATGAERVLGRIEIPRLRIAAIVAEGADPATLDRAVGHVPATALPGRPGNCALAGHRNSFFRGLGAVKENDVIRIVTAERTYAYRVQWSAVVEPRRVDVLDATSARSLTLVTCYPFAFIGPAPQRFVVRAYQVDETATRI